MKADVRESLKHGVNFLDRTCKCSRADRKVWRIVNDKPIEIYNAPVTDSEYTAKRLGTRDYTDPSNCAPNSIVGFAPRIYKENPDEEDDVFCYPTGGLNLQFMHVICSQLKSWLEQDCIVYLGHRKETGAEMDAQVIPGIIVEHKKPRLYCRYSPL